MNVNQISLRLRVIILAILATNGFELFGNEDYFYNKLKFDSVKALREARGRLETRASYIGYGVDLIIWAALEAEISRKKKEIHPEIIRALKANPAECGLVEVEIFSQSNGITTQYYVENVDFVDVGDDAVRILAKELLKNEKTGTIARSPRDGFKYDNNFSHVVCYKLVDGKLKSTEVFMPLLKRSLGNAVEKLKEAEREEKEKRKKSKKPTQQIPIPVTRKPRAPEEDLFSPRESPRIRDEAKRDEEQGDGGLRRALEEADRFKAESERVDRENASKERAAKERVAKERAAKEQAAKEQAAKERAAKEQAAKEQAAKEQAAKKRAAEKAARKKAEDSELDSSYREPFRGPAGWFD